MRKKIFAIVLACALLSVLSVSAFAASKQIYIENTSAISVKMTASLYGLTNDGTYIRIGDAIIRTDYRSGFTPTFSTVDLEATLYRDYDADEASPTVYSGTMVSSANSLDVAVGNYISTGNVVMNASIGAQNIGGSYNMMTPTDVFIYSTLGITLESDGSLAQDSDVTITMGN